ncbi:MAG: site-specific integrase, partial [Thermodesulfobacteriota bacterium]
KSKNNEPRSIPICDALLTALLDLRNNAKSEYVFTTQEGKPYKYPSGWKRAWATALRKSGIGKCRFHDLRHTFASNLIVAQKEDYITVKSLTGHKDTKMLQRYSHTSEEYKRKAISKLGNSLNLDTMDTYMDTNHKNKAPVAIT